MDLALLFINRKFDQLWKDVFSPADKVLDIGCGTTPGYHTYVNGSLTCVDCSKTPIVNVIADGHSLPFKASMFDGALSVNSLYYYSNPKKAVGEFARVLKKRGKLVLVTPFNYPIHDIPHDKCRFTEYGIKELLKDDFVIERIVPVGGVFSIPLVLLRSLSKGLVLASPSFVKPLMKAVAFVAFLVPLLFALVFSLLDVLDRTRRWPIYYFTVARKK